jgi:hypothetical protein
MSDTASETAFLAVLIYEDGPGRRCEEPHVYSATHPEIAYQLALADGNEQRYGRRFIGLSLLEETTEDVEPIARTQGGDANELVVTKDELAAFSDPRWKGVACDETELAKALRGPPLLFEVEGLDSIPWHQYTHAYGTASDVPKDIRRLASADPEVREQAAWQLLGSIYHQGTLYPATSMAAPFLVCLALDKRLPDRSKVLEVLDALAESAAIDPSKIRETWEWRRKNFGERYSKPSAEMAEDEIACFLGVRRAMLAHLAAFQELVSDKDAETARLARSILNHLGRCKEAT